jgi:phospholipid-transporting ATPase
LISEKEYATFQEKLKSIPQSQREKLSVSLIDQLERDIYLIGATAVLDRLQDDVPETIRDMIRASTPSAI